MFAKLAIFVAAVSTVALAQVPAPSCYSGGTGGVSDCAQYINTFCADVAAATFGPGQNGGRCFGVNGHRCDFIAYRATTDPAGNPSQANCNTVLNGVVRSCPYGGKGKINAAPGYFTFTLDPNAGACSSDVQPGS
ncbi:TMV resistance protein Y3 [Cyathus striatus]|nr:TMV resistance protein Y3 [Cyathus striatus]